ncbi:MAG: MhpC4 [Candidatus Saccharibacteria bacterium]|nr:MhpC4 [Candidatus Saccharibacteria bacterium]
MQVITDGLMTHYERAGKGRLILILPGWADTSSSWLPIQKALSATYDVVVLDEPGFGRSQAPHEAWGLDGYTEFIGHFLDKIGAVDLHAVIGHSNGGALAIRGLSRQKFTASKLILVASAGIRSGGSGRKNAFRILAKVGKIASVPLPSSVKHKLRSKLYTSIGSDMLVAEHMQETFKKIVTDDVQADAASLKVSTLLIYGDKDTSTPVEFGSAFNNLIQDSNLEVIDGAGHFLHVENKDRLVKSIQGFLK